MNIIMDKSSIIDIIKRRLSGDLKLDDIYKVILVYCTEKGKSYFNTAHFLEVIIGNKIYMGYFIIALEYYEKKFNICTLTDNKDKILSIH